MPGYILERLKRGIILGGGYLYILWQRGVPLEE